jgi:hypothetical protein
MKNHLKYFITQDLLEIQRNQVLQIIEKAQFIV